MKRTLLALIITAAFSANTLTAQFVPGGSGPRDGTGYQGSGPRDGTGYGAKSGKGKGKGAGTCDQTGPKGPRGQGKGQGSKR